MKLWSLNARSKGQPAPPLLEGKGNLCSPSAHATHAWERGLYPVAKIMGMGSGSNKFCLVLPRCAQDRNHLLVPLEEVEEKRKVWSLNARSKGQPAPPLLAEKGTGARSMRARRNVHAHPAFQGLSQLGSSPAIKHSPPPRRPNPCEA